MITIAITSLVVALYAAAAIRVQRRRGRFEAAARPPSGWGPRCC
jgi:hypothetical protein